MHPQAHERHDTILNDPKGQQYTIFAADVYDQMARDYMRQAGVSFKELRGVYTMQSTGERVDETSFIINTKDLGKVSFLIEGQESILELGRARWDNTRSAALLFTNGSFLDLGLFHSVSEEYAKSQDNYTYDPSTDTYFVAEKEGFQS